MQKPTTVERDESKEIDIRQLELAEKLTELDGAIDEARDSTSTFRDNLVEFYEHRRGLRQRPFPNLPFKDAADIRFPIIDKYIDRLKSMAFNTVIDAPHTARFLPTSNPKSYDNAQNLELYFDYLVNKWRDWRQTVEWLLDRWCEQGKCIAKISYECSYEPVTKVIGLEEALASIQAWGKMKMEMAVKMGQPVEPLTKTEIRSLIAETYQYDEEDSIHKARLDGIMQQLEDGKANIEIITDRASYEGTKVSVIYTLDDITVPERTCRLHEAEWISHDVYYTGRELRQQSKERGGKYDNVDDVIEIVGKGTPDQRQELAQAERAALGTNSDADDGEYINVREVFCWLPVKLIRKMKGKVYGGEDTPVRCVVTYCPDAIEAGALRVMELPYDHGKWPFEECNFEGGERFYDCRGVPQLIKCFQEEYNISRNAAINRRTMTLSPPILTMRAAKIPSKTFRQVGQVFETDVPPTQAMHIPQFPDLSSGFDFDAQAMEQFAAEYLGLPDLRMRGYQDSPTATQVEQVQAPANAALRRRLELFHDFLGRVFWQVFQLEKQYRFGSPDAKQTFPNMGNPEQSQAVTAADFANEYIIQSGGDLQRMDSMLANQMMFIAYQAAMNQPQLAPMVRPWDINHYFFTKVLGPLAARTWLRPRAESAQYEQQFMQMQAQAAAQMQVKGKNPRNKDMKQVPTGKTGIVPQ